MTMPLHDVCLSFVLFLPFVFLDRVWSVYVPLCVLSVTPCWFLAPLSNQPHPAITTLLLNRAAHCQSLLDCCAPHEPVCCLFVFSVCLPAHQPATPTSLDPPPAATPPHSPGQNSDWMLRSTIYCTTKQCCIPFTSCLILVCIWVLMLSTTGADSPTH